MKIAIVRGEFLNAYEMQIFEPLIKTYDITAFGSLRPFHDEFAFPTVKLPSPMDLPEFPYKMPILNRLFIDAHYLYGLEKQLKGFDIVHSAETFYHYTQQALNARKKRYVKKVIATVLENIPFNNEGIWGRKGFKKRAREELDHIIALTERTKLGLVLEGADPEKITVVSHGINTRKFSLKKDLNTDKKNLKIMFAGRLEVYKGIYEILYAIKSLLLDKELKDYNLMFIFIGNGSEKNKLLEMEKRLGIEEYVVHKEVRYEQMPDEYKEADIFVAPSKASRYWQEQYNTTLLEAQASGLPIVTTDSGGIVENVGDAAIIVQSGDVLSLAEGIKKFILDAKLRKYYSEKARARAERVHDVEIIAKQIDRVYEKVLNQ